MPATATKPVEPAAVKAGKAGPVVVELIRTSEHTSVIRYDSSDAKASVRTVYVMRDTLTALGDPRKLRMTLAASTT